jgi:hypothetical protein
MRRGAGASGWGGAAGAGLAAAGALAAALTATEGRAAGVATTAGAATAGRCTGCGEYLAACSACLRSRMALIASPGLETLARLKAGLGSGAGRLGAAEREPRAK